MYSEATCISDNGTISYDHMQNKMVLLSFTVYQLSTQLIKYSLDISVDL